MADDTQNEKQFYINGGDAVDNAQEAELFLNPEILYAGNTKVLSYIEQLKKLHKVKATDLNFTPATIEALPWFVDKFPDIKKAWAVKSNNRGLALTSSTGKKFLVNQNRVALIDDNGTFDTEDAVEMVMAASQNPKWKGKKLHFNNATPEQIILLRKACDELGLDYHGKGTDPVLDADPTKSTQAIAALEAQFDTAYKTISDNINSAYNPDPANLAAAEADLSDRKLEKVYYSTLQPIKDSFRPIDNELRALYALQNDPNKTVDELRTAYDDVKKIYDDFITNSKDNLDAVEKSLQDGGIALDSDQKLAKALRILHEDKDKAQQYLDDIENRVLPLAEISEEIDSLQADSSDFSEALEKFKSASNLQELKDFQQDIETAVTQLQQTDIANRKSGLKTKLKALSVAEDNATKQKFEAFEKSLETDIEAFLQSRKVVNALEKENAVWADIEDSQDQLSQQSGDIYLTLDRVGEHVQNGDIDAARKILEDKDFTDKLTQHALNAQTLSDHAESYTNRYETPIEGTADAFTQKIHDRLVRIENTVTKDINYGHDLLEYASKISAEVSFRTSWENGAENRFNLIDKPSNALLDKMDQVSKRIAEIKDVNFYFDTPEQQAQAAAELRQAIQEGNILSPAIYQLQETGQLLRDHEGKVSDSVYTDTIQPISDRLNHIHDKFKKAQLIDEKGNFTDIEKIVGGADKIKPAPANP